MVLSLVSSSPGAAWITLSRTPVASSMASSTGLSALAVVPEKVRYRVTSGTASSARAGSAIANAITAAITSAIKRVLFMG